MKKILIRQSPRIKSPTAVTVSRFRDVVVFLSVCAAFSLSGKAFAVTYTFTDLGTLGGSRSHAYGVNDHGQVVGSSDISTGDRTYHATLWVGTTLTDLGTLGGKNSAATGINSAGKVVGWANARDGRGLATLWNGTTPSQLTTPDGANSGASAINTAGQVVGSIGWTATLWNGEAPTELETPPGARIGGAVDISDTGKVVGYSEFLGLGYRATVWNDASATLLSTQYSFAYGVNDAGQVVGSVGGYGRATLWNGTTPTDLGTLARGDQSVAYAINSAGKIVGNSNLVFSGRTRHATLWQGNEVIDLNTLVDPSLAGAGWYLTDARDINDRGWIVGTATNRLTGEEHAYLLSAVPEPRAGALLLAGLGLLGFVFRRP